MGTDIKPRALIYVRTSGEESEEENSLYIQNTDCVKFCQYKDYEILNLGYTITVEQKDRDGSKEIQAISVPGIVDNGYTGANLKRPGIQQVIQMAKNKEFDILVVWKLDRFSRKVLDVLTVLEEFDKLGVKFFCEKESFIDTSSIYGKFMLQMLAVIAELERENIKLRTQGGRILAMKNGHWHGSPPYGFDKNENFELIPNQDKLKIVEDLYNWIIYDGLSLRDCADELNKRGLKTTRNGEWTGTTVRNILVNEIYTGKTVLRKKHKKELQIIYTVEPILISPVKYQKALMILSSHRNSLRGETKHPAIFARYLYCANCGGKMYPQGKNTVKQGLVISYSGNRNNKEKSKSRCANCGWVRQNALSLAIIPELIKITSNPQFWLANIEDKKVEDLTPILGVEYRFLENLYKSRDKVEQKFDIGFYKTKEECAKALKDVDRAIGLKKNDIILLKQRMATQSEKNVILQTIISMQAKLVKVEKPEDIMSMILDKIYINTRSKELTIHLRFPMTNPIKQIYTDSEHEGAKLFNEAWAKLASPEGTHSRALALQASILGTSDKRVVVDKSLLGKKSCKYHYTWCPGAKQIKEENKIWFSSDKEAEANGYTLAGNCSR